MSELLAKTAARYVKPAYTEVKVGDTVRVYTRIKEGEKERTQYFEGLVIRRKGGIGSTASFTVRRIASGVGVERIFPLHSPLTTKVEVQRAAKVRRATLYSMRGLTGKAARLTEQPVDRKARETKHPWPALYNVQTEQEAEAKKVPKDAEGTVQDHVADEANDSQAPAESSDQGGADQTKAATVKEGDVGQDEAAEAAEKTESAAKQAEKDAPPKESKVKDAESAKDAEPAAEKAEKKADTDSGKPESKSGQ